MLIYFVRLMLPLVLRVCLILASLCSISECTLNLEPSPCPIWMYRQNPQDKECKCDDLLDGSVTCLDGKYRVSVMKYFCTILIEKHSVTAVSLGTCPYSSGRVLPENISELQGDSIEWCVMFHWRGQLCGACEENYTLPVYSYYLGCVKCEDYKYGWVKFIAAAFLPLTVFYILVIVFQISVTLSSLNGFVCSVKSWLARLLFVRYTPTTRWIHTIMSLGHLNCVLMLA